MKKQLLFLVLACMAYAMQAAVITVPADGSIATAIEGAAAGDVIELTGASYVENITFTKAVTIRSSASLESPAVIQGTWKIRDGVTLENLAFDGNKTVSDGVRVDGDHTGKSVRIEGCSFRNFTSRFFYVSLSNKVQHITINNCLFDGTNESYRAIRVNDAHLMLDSLTITNSTFYNFNTGSNYFFQVNCGEEEVLTPIVLVDHCTFSDCFDRRGVYLFNAGKATVSNCIFSFSEKKDDTKSLAVYHDQSIVTNIISYNVDTYGSAPKYNVIAQNPLFVDAENANYQLYKDSPAVGAATDGSNLGDPRWGVSDEEQPKDKLPYTCFKKPYSMSPTTSSVRILWQTLDTIASGTVYYGTAADKLDKQLTASTGWNVEGEGFVHVIELTGLQPFTTYYYQVGDEIRRFETIGKAKTAPEKGTDFRLVSFSDVHDNNDDIWANSVHTILGTNPDMWMTIGDLVTKGDGRTWNSAFFEPGEPMLTNVTLTTTIGNHETMDKADMTAPTTYYDYFSMPSHGYIDEHDSIDTRGESYYALDYGDVQILSCNFNEGEDDPSFYVNSLQYNWLDEQLAQADNKWIFIFAHVNVFSSSYHGQWSASLKEHIAPLLEKHALNGKHILVFGADEHNFEHLYKAGVHYVRPGALNGTNRDQYNKADEKYSLMFNKIAGFSTIDVSENGEKVTLIARDTTGAEFYSYVFTREAMKPSLYITDPKAGMEPFVDKVTIKWSCFVPEGDATINLYYSTDSINGTPIATNLTSDVTVQNSYEWHVRDIYPKGKYWIYGTIDDGKSAPVRSYAKGTITLAKDTIPPTPPTQFRGAGEDGKIVLNWLNPVYETPIMIGVNNFEAGIDGVTGVGDSGDGSFEETEGQPGKGLLMHYNVMEAWGEYAAEVAFDKAQDFTYSPYLEFYYKGDGSSRMLRLIVKEDNDYDGEADDWWYNETLPMSVTEWTKVKLDIRIFEALSWHSNMNTKCEAKSVVSIHFIVPSATACTDGKLYLDEIAMSGMLPPAPDFEATVIVRRDDRFPTDHTDGTVVYEGTAEQCVDVVSDTENYYYAAFSRDDLKNYSVPATWMGSVTTVGVDNLVTNGEWHIFPNPTKEQLRVTLPTGRVWQVTLTDLQGKQVLAQEGCQSSVMFDITPLTAGVYCVAIHSTEQAYYQKVIIQ